MDVPKWCLTIAFDFEEKYWRDQMEKLDDLFAQEKMAGHEVGTCANEGMGVGSVMVCTCKVT